MEGGHVFFDHVQTMFRGGGGHVFFRYADGGGGGCRMFLGPAWLKSPVPSSGINNEPSLNHIFTTCFMQNLCPPNPIFYFDCLSCACTVKKNYKKIKTSVDVSSTTCLKCCAQFSPPPLLNRACALKLRDLSLIMGWGARTCGGSLQFHEARTIFFFWWFLETIITTKQNNDIKTWGHHTCFLVTAHCSFQETQVKPPLKWLNYRGKNPT